jgi:hypothetical protein
MIIAMTIAMTIAMIIAMIIAMTIAMITAMTTTKPIPILRIINSTVAKSIAVNQATTSTMRTMTISQPLTYP